MTTEVNLSGPTVTVFGDRDAIDAALNDELGRRGCSTHSVTVPTGWLASVTNAIIRLDTRAGERAIEELASLDTPTTHVVAICATTDDPEASARLDRLGRDCGERHDVSVVWYAPFEVRLDEEAVDPVLVPADLAMLVVDEVGHQQAWRTAPSYASQVLEPGRHRGHS